MLKIIVKKGEIFDNSTNEFRTVKEDTEITLEHSLVSIAKWESKWHKPFLNKEQKTSEEIIDYIKCMTISQNIPDDIYYLLSPENYKAVNKYIENPMTATTFHSHSQNSQNYRKQEVLTNEIIYYWMIQHNIPVQFEKWHLNRLLTLIRVCSIKNNSKDSKMSKKDTLMSNRAINEARRARYHS